eukprot:GABV01001893.1.p1 GENE.GABV01001893.1~~GABV01001893.1.p1  ORF type:complete len:125 (+),score=35.62 GABV01001893.1:295-669(+)
MSLSLKKVRSTAIQAELAHANNALKLAEAATNTPRRIQELEQQFQSAAKTLHQMLLILFHVILICDVTPAEQQRIFSFCADVFALICLRSTFKAFRKSKTLSHPFLMLDFNAFQYSSVSLLHLE